MSSTPRTPIRSTLVLICAVIGSGWMPTQVRAHPEPSTPLDSADSLRVAESMALRGESCVAAFGIAARQFDGKSESPDAISVADVFQVLATVSRFGGDRGAANIFSEAGLILADSFYSPDDSRRAPFLLEHALSMRLSGRLDAHAGSTALVEEGIRLGQQGSVDPGVHANLLQARANLIRAAHDPDQARTQYAEALEFRLQADPSHRLAVVDNEAWLALVTLLAGQVSAAEQLSLHCQADLVDLGLPDHPLLATLTSNLALIAKSRGDIPLAIERSRLANSEQRRARKQIFPGFSQHRLESPFLYGISYLQLQEGEPELAWASFIEAYQHGGSQALALDQARRSDPAFVSRIQEATTQRTRRFSNARTALAALRKQPAPGPARDEAIRALIQYARQMATTLLLRDRLIREYGVHEPATPSLEQLQQSLHPSQALVGYLTSEVGSRSRVADWPMVIHAVVIRHDQRPVWIQVPPESGLPGAPQFDSRTDPVWTSYSALMRTASEWPTRLPDDPEIHDLLHGLYVNYFKPVEPYLDGTREILLLSTSLFPGFPFPALIDDAGAALVDRYSFRHLVGSDDIAEPAARDSATPAPSLVLGDPAYDGADDGATADADPTLAQALTTYANTVLPRSVIADVLEEGEAGLSRLPRLTSSGWEARGVASMTDPVILATGVEATEQRLRLALGGQQAQHYRWIHLASHALIHPTFPEQSALALSPLDGEGLLYVEEIGFWTLNCDLITLSGCQTGGGPRSWTAGPLGFVQALHAAGARNLLLSTGKVDDIATALLMERFYANVSDRASPRVDPAAGAPLSYSEALAEAQRWLRDLRTPDGERPFAHPVYWAAFRLHGDGI